MMATFDYMLASLRNKEVAMGFDRIWSIGE